MRQGCIDVARESGFRECYVRPLIYLAEGGWNLTIDAGKPHCGIAAWEWKQYFNEEALAKGLRANVSSFTRHHPNVMMTKAKISGNYVNSVLAKTESLRLGFDEFAAKRVEPPCPGLQALDVARQQVQVDRVARSC